MVRGVTPSPLAYIVIGILLIALIIAITQIVKIGNEKQNAVENISSLPGVMRTPLPIQNSGGVNVPMQSTTVPFNPKTDLAKKESSPRPSEVIIEPKLYLSCYDPNTGQSGIKCGLPQTEIPIGKAMILEINIDNIDPSRPHVIRTRSWSTYKGNFDPKPNEWDIWGTLEYQEEIPAGETFHQTNIYGQIIGMAGWWTGKKKVDIYWDDNLVKTFYFYSVPRTD